MIVLLVAYAVGFFAALLTIGMDPHPGWGWKVIGWPLTFVWVTARWVGSDAFAIPRRN